MLRDRKGFGLAVLTFALLALAPARALSIGPLQDLRAESPKGKFVAEAWIPWFKSREFTRQMQITLSEAGSWTSRWSYTQAPEESAPSFLIPTDDGYLIVEEAGDSYSVFDPKGTRTSVLSAWRATPHEEKEEFVGIPRTGGEFLEAAFRDFIEHEGTLLYVLRTYWGRVFLIDYRKSKWVRDPELERAVERRILADTRDWLTTFNGEIRTPCEDCGGTHISQEVLARLCIVRLHGIPEGSTFVQQALTLKDDDRHTRVLAKVPAGPTMPLPPVSRECMRTVIKTVRIKLEPDSVKVATASLVLAPLAVLTLLLWKRARRRLGRAQESGSSSNPQVAP